MLKIELSSYGYYDAIKEIRMDLEQALGKRVSNKQKDESICKALGAVKALWNLVKLDEIDNDIEADNESNT